jgi:amino acid adenylation domain-containing protein
VEEAGDNLRQRLENLPIEKRLELERRLRGVRSNPPVPALGKRPVDATFAPLSFGQRGLWLLNQIITDLSAYNVFPTWLIKGPLNVEALEKAVDEIVNRHEILRTSFELKNHEPCQVVLPPAQGILERVDLRTASLESRASDCHRFVVMQYNKPFDISSGPYFRAHLIILGDTEHVLLLVFHHAVTDGWSTGLVSRELGLLYNAFTRGRAHELPEIQVQYGDFAYRQRHASDVAVERDLAYWKRTLSDAPVLLELPTDKLRPAVQSFTGAKHAFDIGPELTAEVKTFARERDTTPFMVLLAAFKLLLSRYSGQSDICVGTPFAGRSDPGMEHVIGYFVNTVVVRSRIEETVTFVQLVTAVRRAAVEAFDHASAPIDQVADHLGHSRDLSYNPLFQVMFVLQSADLMNLELGGLEVEEYTLDGDSVPQQGNDTSKFDLTLEFSPVNGALRGRIEYCTDLFDGLTVRHLSEHYLTLLRSAVRDPFRDVSELPLAGPADTARVVNCRSDARDNQFEDNVADRFYQVAGRTPDFVALIHQGRETTCEALRRKVDLTAILLDKACVLPGDRVGLAMEPSVERIAAVLAILKCDGLFVPIDPDGPLTRNREIAADAGIALIVADNASAAAPGLSGAKVLNLEDRPACSGMEASVQRQVITDRPADGAAYVMYTSGSTGRPKGVVGTHRGILNRVQWMQDEFPYGPDERCCHRTNPVFVDSVAEVFSPLLAGVPLVVLSRSECADPECLISTLARYRISRISLVPVLLRAMLDSPRIAERLGALRLWVSSGEVLPWALWERFHELLPDALMLNLYGCTEVAADATWFDCQHAVAGRRIPIGRPLSNTGVHVLDSRMQPQPVGVPGDLYVSGVSLADGYWNAPQLTEQRFVANPFVKDGPRFYKTGDLARFLDDGNLDYLGRADSQVKYHGIRIEPAEVEAVVKTHPSVSEAAVALTGEADSKRILAAWYVCSPGKSLADTELRRHLDERLPRQWIPTAFVELETLPLLSSGKVDRRSLSVTDTRACAPRTAYKAPGDEMEKNLAFIWSEVLGIEHIGIHDNFFDLGGHSILAFDILQRISADFDRQLEVAAIFQFPTIAGLAQRLRRPEMSELQKMVLVPVRDSGDSSPFFCIPAAASGVYSIYAIASEFGERPCIGVQPLGLEADAEPQDSIEVMAETYVAAIRARQPVGPYYLGGRCFGGLVALEVARRLEEEGAEVGLVALLDTTVPMGNLPSLLRKCRGFGRLSLLLKYPFDRLLARSARRRIETNFEKSLLQLSGPIVERMRALYRAHKEALENYNLDVIDVPVVWVRPRSVIQSLRVGWTWLVKSRLSCVKVPGDHFSMFEAPNVTVLSRRLANELHREV